MTKGQKIEHWMNIVAAVFTAEDTVKPQWEDRLRQALNMPPDERLILADDYLRAVATEIVEHGDWNVRGEEEERKALFERGAKIIKSLFNVNIRSKSRDREVTDLRAMFCYRMRKEGYSLSDIGRYLGLDHSTVHHNCKKMADALDVPAAYQELVDRYIRFNSVLENGE